MSRRVYLSQALCPKRHAIGALAAEIEEPADAVAEIEFVKGANARARKFIDMLLAQRRIDPWCVICESPRSEWLFETGRTAWRTLEEATPELRAVERQNLAARAYFVEKRRKAAGN